MRTAARTFAMGLAALAAMSGPAGAQSAQSAQPTIRVELRSPAEVDLVATPGQAMTFVLRITNTSARAAEVATDISLPKGWTATIPPVTLTLAPGGAELELVTVVPGPLAASGLRSIDFVALSGNDQTPALSSWLVLLREVRDLRVTVADAPPYLANGQRVAATFIVTNYGNAPRDVRVVARNGQDRPIPASWNGGVLGPGQSVTVTVELGSERLNGVTRRDALRLKVADADGTAAAESSITYDVVPQGTEAAAARPRLPSVLTFNGGNGRDPRFASFEAGGALNQSGSARLDVLARAKSADNELWGESDAYQLSFRSKPLTLALGDRVWGLSPLTEPGRFGLGGTVGVSVGHVVAGALFDDGSRVERTSRQEGGYAGFRFGPAELTGQYLVRSRVHPAELWTFRARFPLAPRTLVDVESGTGRADGATDRASSVQIEGMYARLNFTIKKAAVGDRYPIRERSALDDGGQAAWRVWKQLQVDAAYNVLATPLDRDLPAFIPNRQRSGGAGIGVGSWMRVEARRQEWTRDDAAFGGGWLRETVAGRIMLPLGPVHIGPRATVGNVSRPGDASTTPFRVVGVEGSVRVASAGNVTLAVEQMTGEAGDPRIRRLSVSLAGQLKLTARTMLSGTVSSAAEGAEPWFQGARIADLIFEQRVWLGHRIGVTARGQWGGAGGFGDRTLVRVDYRIPIGLPVGRRQGAGTVIGKFATADTGKPVANVLVRLDGEHAVLTNKKGEARFHGVAPGTYFPTADVTAGGMDLTTIPRLPEPVTVGAESTTTFEVGVVRRGALHGVVTHGRAGVAGAVIEAVGQGQRVRRVTDADGVFELENVTPGVWVVTVVDLALPPFTYLPTQQTKATVEPGERADVRFLIVDKERIIK